jgi:hypothetical protein
MTKRKFKIGDLVEWDDGKRIRQGEIKGYDCYYMPWKPNGFMDGMIGDAGFLMRMEFRWRQKFYCVLDLEKHKEYIIHEDRLRRTKVKVRFTRSAIFI